MISFNYTSKATASSKFLDITFVGNWCNIIKTEIELIE